MEGIVNYTSLLPPKIFFFLGGGGGGDNVCGADSRTEV